MTGPSPGRFIVSIIGPRGSAVGLGVLVGPREVVTCAHVINQALGLDSRSQPQPASAVRVRFPLTDTPGPVDGVSAQVVMWQPPPRAGTVGDDLAGLLLVDDAAALGAMPARLAVNPVALGSRVRVFGYPGDPPRPDGAWVWVRVEDRVEGGRLQLESSPDAALRVQPGYSGSPLCDEATGRVVGLIAAAAPGRHGERDSYAITADRLREAWPQVLAHRGRGSAAHGSDQDRVGPVCVLRVSDPQFGPHHHTVREQAGPPDLPERVRERTEVSNLALRNALFIGRTEMLGGIAAHHGSGRPIVVLRGLGGVGKSQLALEYSHRGREQGDYVIVWWIRAQESAVIAADLADLAASLGLRGGDDIDSAARAVLAHLGGRDDWLLVFDNAEQPADVISHVPNGHGHVLVTSRQRDWSGLGALVDVGAFTRQESLALLRVRTGRDEADAAGVLADELGDLPLAVAQAAAYVDSHSLAIADYVALYRTASGRLLAVGLNPGEYPRSVATTWLIHMEHFRREQPVALDLLRLCAFLAPVDIPLDLLLAPSAELPPTLAPLMTDVMAREEAVGALRRANIVERTSRDRLGVHRLVQAVTRDQLGNRGCNEWSARTVAAVESVFPPDPEEPTSWPVAHQLSVHALSAAGRVSTALPTAVIIAALLLSRLATYLAARGQLPLAGEIADRSVGAMTAAVEALSIGHQGIRQEIPGLADEVDRHLAHILLSASSVHLAADKRAPVLRYAHQAIEIVERCFGPNSPLLVPALNALAISCDQADHATRGTLLHRALDLQTRHGLPDDPQLIQTIANLAALDCERGDLDSGFDYYHQALELLDCAGRAKTGQAADVHHNLGNIAYERGDLRSALAEYQRAFEIMKATHDPNHPSVAMTAWHMGRVLNKLGQLDAARAFLAYAVAVDTASLGPDHPQTVEALTTLDAVLVDLRRLSGSADA
jgi:tetratricopeptide (TPR) repeat protein